MSRRRCTPTCNDGQVCDDRFLDQNPVCRPCAALSPQDFKQWIIARRKKNLPPQIDETQLSDDFYQLCILLSNEQKRDDYKALAFLSEEKKLIQPQINRSSSSSSRIESKTRPEIRVESEIPLHLPPVPSSSRHSFIRERKERKSEKQLKQAQFQQDLKEFEQWIRTVNFTQLNIPESFARVINLMNIPPTTLTRKRPHVESEIKSNRRVTSRRVRSPEPEPEPELEPSTLELGPISPLLPLEIPDTEMQGYSTNIPVPAPTPTPILTPPYDLGFPDFTSDTAPILENAESPSEWNPF